jgi:hypothetical protein
MHRHAARRRRLLAAQWRLLAAAAAAVLLLVLLAVQVGAAAAPRVSARLLVPRTCVAMATALPLRWLGSDRPACCLCTLAIGT